VNLNGTIDSGRELFGENSHALSGAMNNQFTNFKNGYQALAQYDYNQDGRIDIKDRVFGKLRLWIDSNKNGLSEKNELKELIEANGGKVGSGVTSKTSFLLAGDGIGPSKLEKAVSLGIRILSEDEFLTLIA
jgi:NAD-dependent DNA ligase